MFSTQSVTCSSYCGSYTLKEEPTKSPQGLLVTKISLQPEHSMNPDHLGGSSQNCEVDHVGQTFSCCFFSMSRLNMLQLLVFATLLSKSKNNLSSSENEESQCRNFHQEPLVEVVPMQELWSKFGFRGCGLQAQSFLIG